MSMQSTEQIDALQELPGYAYEEHLSAEDIVADLAEMDAAFFAADTTTESSQAMLSAVGGGDVDDKVQQAYEMAYPNQAAEHSLHEHLVELETRGEGSTEGFINGIKGKMGNWMPRNSWKSTDFRM